MRVWLHVGEGGGEVIWIGVVDKVHMRDEGNVFLFV